MVVYIDGFKCNKDIAAQFSGQRLWYEPEKDMDLVQERQSILDLLDSSEVLLAWYGGGAYEGRALVVYRLNDQLYEVNGSHCSCNGLEGQWDPEKTSLSSLEMRNPRDVDHDHEFILAYNEMLDFLDKDW